jgi:hypothetical protein
MLRPLTILLTLLHTQTHQENLQVAVLYCLNCQLALAFFGLQVPLTAFLNLL